MAIKVRSNQIELADTFDFAPSGSVLVATPTSDNQAANKAYVDSQLPDSFAGGDGIDIADGEGTDTISVDLDTVSPALEFNSAKLRVKVKAETGGSITRDADGLYIADAAIGNAKLAGSIANDKLANSTISGKSLGANLDNLSAGNGLALASPYNGSAAQTLDLQLDASTLSKSASGLKVADGGIGGTQIADDSIAAAKLQDGCIDASAKLADSIITGPKLSVQPYREKFSGNGSTTAFTVSSKQIYTGGEDGMLVFRNGLLMEGVASSPSGQDQYTVANSGSDVVITFGTAPSAGDVIFFMAVLIS